MHEAQRVLIVDDDRTTLDLLRAVLARYRLSIALDGPSALKVAAAAHPDLILLDVLMPGMDGYAVAQRLRTNPRTARIPIVFLTSMDQPEDEVRAFDAGAVDFITKPIRPSVVQARVTTQLELLQQRRELEALNQTLEDRNHVIAAERERADALLRNTLPRKSIEQLKRYGRTVPELFPDVSVVFTDIVEFTRISSQLDPHVLIEELNALFTAFDERTARNGCERIKTIGDAYLAVCGMPEPDPDHAHKAVQLALDLLDAVRAHNARPSRPTRVTWAIRAGVNSGPVMGAVVGTTKYIYDVFGDAINTAARMEQLSEPMRVNVSETTRALTAGYFSFERRPPSPVKGKGELQMGFVLGPLGRVA